MWQRIGVAEDIETVGIGVWRDLGDALTAKLYAECLLGHRIVSHVPVGLDGAVRQIGRDGWHGDVIDDQGILIVFA